MQKLFIDKTEDELKVLLKRINDITETISGYFADNAAITQGQGREGRVIILS